jgi:superfamily II DNA or RNA helicase
MFKEAETFLHIPTGQNPQSESATRTYKKTPRKWQLAAYKQLKNAPYVIIEGPTGSGKSICAKMLLIEKLQRPNSKVIVVIPQNSILEAWEATEIEGIGRWNPILTSSLKNNSVKADLLKFATQKENGALICTHLGLIANWDWLKEYLKKSNITLWIDEAHHLEYEQDLKTKKNFVNKIGNILQESMALGFHIGISSATFFRGDKSLILNPKIKKAFKSYRVEYAEYIQGLQYIKDIRYVVETYKHTPLERLQALQRGTIIYIPSPNTKESRLWENGCKFAQLSTLLNNFGVTHEINGIHYTKSGKKVVELITEQHMDAKQKAIHSGNADYIISLRRFLEGANWLEAHTAYIIGRRSSHVQIIQSWGRLLRDYPTKKEAKLLQLFPTPKTMETKEIENRVEDYLHNICGALLLKELLQPKYTLLQKYGAETAFKALQAATTTLQREKTNPERAARKIEAAIQTAIKRAQPNISKKTLQTLSQLAEKLVIEEIGKHTRQNPLEYKTNGHFNNKNLNVKITERVEKIGSTLDCLRILSRNLSGDFPETFKTENLNRAEENLEEIAKLARKHQIPNLQAWKVWASTELQSTGCTQTDFQIQNPESLPEFDSWETLLNPKLKNTWEGNFKTLLEHKYSVLPFIRNPKGNPPLLVRWLQSQEERLQNQDPKTTELEKFLHEENCWPLPILIPNDRKEEARFWEAEFGKLGLQVHPQEMLEYLAKKGIPNKLKPIEPFVKKTLPVEAFLAENSEATPGSLLEVVRLQNTETHPGYLKFLKSLAEEKLCKKQHAFPN